LRQNLFLFAGTAKMAGVDRPANLLPRHGRPERMEPKPEIVELNAHELESLLDQIAAQLGEPMVRPLRLLLTSYLTLVSMIETKTASIRRLRRLLFGAKTERTSQVVGNGETTDRSPDRLREAPNPGAGEQAQGESKDASSGGSSRPRRRPGHGRIPAEAYTGCQQVLVHHGSLHPGDSCPDCREGTLYRQNAWGQLVRLFGQPPIGGTRYQLERLRCGLCGKPYTAEPPEDAGPAKYDPTVGSTIGVLRYGLGVPWKRIEYMQRCAGIPLPASMQWEIVRDAIGYGLQDAYDQLAWIAAQGDLVYNDDTNMRVLELGGRIKSQQPLRDDAPERRGVFTTSILSEADGRPPVVLFFTGAHHAGENLRKVLLRRNQGLPPPMQMCDALARNIPGELKTLLGNCLTHARRNFVDVYDAFPDEVQYVLLQLKHVYRADSLARLFGLSPETRLELHQRRSGPVMAKLHQWLKERLDERQVEPNSSLGKAIRYMLKHWEKLTLFLRVPGAPLDSNAVERALKLAIRHRRNSLFYKTVRGAAVGDIYMSLISTCYLAQVDPFDYLTELQRQARQVKENPADWMPWNYRRQKAASPPMATAKA
jgi:transposase